ncbi:unnamed protein product, partial [marine sediment metagenome]
QAIRDEKRWEEIDAQLAKEYEEATGEKDAVKFAIDTKGKPDRE